MTETVSDAPPEARAKRRQHPESRQRPQSRNPSAAMEESVQARETVRATSGPPRRLWRAGTPSAGLRTVLRRIPLPPWWPAALCVLVGVVAGAGYGLLRPAQYTATSYVAVVPEAGGGPMTALGFAQAYGRIATDTAVLAGAQQRAGVPVATLKSGVEAATSPDAPLIEITGTAPRAGQAAQVANAVARSLTEVAGASSAQTGVELTAFSRARAPREPSGATPLLTTAVGGSAGVLVGALVLLVRPRRDEERAQPVVSAPAAEEPAVPAPAPRTQTQRKPAAARPEAAPAGGKRKTGGTAATERPARPARNGRSRGTKENEQAKRTRVRDEETVR